MFKVNNISEVRDVDALYCIKTATDTEFSIVVTDAFGAIVNLKDLQTPAGIQGIASDDGTIEVTGTTFKNLRLSTTLVDAINNALKPGDNISELLNDAGYLTSFTEIDPIFQASEASNFVSGDKANLDNQSGVNTGDETTLSIQTKRPLKTVDNKSLEGTGNIEIDYNTVINKPTEFPPSAHTHTKSQITDFAHTHPISDVTGLPTALDDLQLNKEDKSNKNIANGYAGLDSSGKIIPTQLPALAITDTFVVASQTAQLALVAEVGDIAIRTDLNKSFILRVTGASTLANWQELLSPTSVDQTIIDGSTNAVSGNAVFDALATKAPISSVHNPVTLGTANGLSLANQELSLGLASSSVTGALSGSDWNTFNNKVDGTGTNNFLTKWSGTNTVAASGAWRETSNRLANAADNGSSEFQVTGQIDLKSKNTQGDGGQLGAELLTTGTGDASWTGTSFATGYTHVAGSATTLTSTLSPVVSNLYQVAYTVTGRTAGSFTIAFGGATTSGITASSAVGHKASTTGTLVITPTSDFNGTIVLSIKQITAGTASFVFRDNGGTIRSELRILEFNNTASGLSALRNNTTGSSNTANGTSSLRNNTTGSSNTASGVNALQNNTTGNNNTASGVNVLQNNTTGGNNTASGVNALLNNTTGNNNTANGISAGRFISNGATSLTVANNSTFLGANTKALADNSTNETVVGDNAIGDGSNTVSIGNTSVVSSRLRGRILQGSVVDNLIDSGQFSGNVLATGFKTASGTASQFLKANGSVDSNTYLTSASLPTVDQTIIDGSTNAVSGNAVFDALATKAPLASPALTGTPTAPTATAGTNTTQVATTAFVEAGLNLKSNLSDITLQRAYDTSTDKKIQTLAIKPFTLKAQTAAASDNVFVIENSSGFAVASVGAQGKLWAISASVDGNVTGNFFIKRTSPINNILLAGGADLAQNTAFNKNFGTTAGTVVEGGTLGSNAYSSTAYLPLSGGTLTGIVTAPTAPAGTNTTQIATTAFVKENARPYKVYTVNMNQTTTSAPTIVTTYENTLGGSIVWTRIGVGDYRGTLTGAFTSLKIVAFTSLAGAVSMTPLFINGERVSNNEIRITTYNGMTPTDGLMTNAIIEFRVYN